MPGTGQTTSDERRALHKAVLRGSIFCDKLITHLTMRTVDESGAESMEELHFFYDVQSRPAFVEYNGTKYRYVYNLQGDIVGIVDTTGVLVVEYKYEAGV